MAGLKRMVIDTARQLKALREAHQALQSAYDQTKRDHDTLLRFLIGAARESQERALMGRP